jgi:hypothetical protein
MPDALVEAGLDILNAIKDSIWALDVNGTHSASRRKSLVPCSLGGKNNFAIHASQRPTQVPQP